MKIDSAVVVAPAGVSASSNSQNITDVWVEENAANLGAYELPCNFPVLDQDSVHFVISPGVWQSGQSLTRVVYPMMNADAFTTLDTPGHHYSHVPTFKYKPAAGILFNEDFEISSEYNNNMTKTSDSAKYGYFCGKITVGPNDSSVMACQKAFGGQPAPYALTTGQEIWLELDYKSDVPFWSGIIAHFNSGLTDTIQILFLLPTVTWHKEYIKLSETVGNEGANTYNLYFQGLNPSGYGGGSVYLDNIRLVHL